jgi:actin-related protein
MVSKSQVHGEGVAAAAAGTSATPSGNAAAEEKIEQEILEKKYYLGEQSISFPRDNTDILPSYLRGEIKDEKAFSELLTHVYGQLGVQPQDYALLMSEPSLPQPKQREKFCQLAFE